MTGSHLQVKIVLLKFFMLAKLGEEYEFVCVVLSLPRRFTCDISGKHFWEKSIKSLFHFSGERGNS